MRFLATSCGLFVLLLGTVGTASAAVCDPPGPPPRFNCQWSTDACDWICAICDPFGVPPRQGCTWSLDLCNWVCPGYTGVEVNVETLGPPAQDATVYVRLSSLCTATGAGAFCNGSFTVFPGMPVAAKCQAIANVVSNDCSTAGYVVTRDDCATTASFTASNLGCPPTPFALGLSNDPEVFDQTDAGPMPDGETERITGSNATCALTPGPVSNLQLALVNGGANLQLTWDAATDADDYIIYSDAAPNGSFSTVEGTARNGNGYRLSLPAGSEFYLVAGRNAACGVGPKE
jgi:hypothetical protein